MILPSLQPKLRLAAKSLGIHLAPASDMAVHRRFENYSCAVPRSRRDFQNAAEIVGAPVHAGQAVTITGAGDVKTPAIVAQLQFQPTTPKFKFDFGTRARRMARDIIYRLLEDHEHFATRFGWEGLILVRVRSAE